MPAGNSWGTPVRAGTSRNVVADPQGLRRDRAACRGRRAPGHGPGRTGRRGQRVGNLGAAGAGPAGRGRAAGAAGPLHRLRRRGAARLRATPCTTSAPSSTWPSCREAERRAIRGVVALDRVGVRASAVPVCSARPSGNELRADVRDAARRGRRPHPRSCSGNTTSDHWSYAKAGVPAIRLGSIPYAGYHSPGDTPDVVDRRQIDRVGTAHVGVAAESVIERRAVAPRATADADSGITARERATARGPDVIEDPAARSARHHPRGEASVERVRHRLDRLHLVSPQHDLDEDALHRLGLEVHVEDEVAERVDDHRVAAASPSPAPSAGWPPMTRSAPASANARAARRWLASGTCVY